MAIQQAFENIDFVINGGTELPSPTQMQVMPGDLFPKDQSLGSVDGDSDTSSTMVRPTASRLPPLERRAS